MSPEGNIRKKLGRGVFCVGLPLVVGLAIHMLLHVKGKVLHTDWMLPFVMVLPVLIAGFVASRQNHGKPAARGVTAGVILTVMMTLFLFDELPWHNHWFYFLEWLPTVENGGHFTLDHGIMWFATLTAVFGLVLIKWRREQIEPLMKWLLVAAQAWAVFSLLSVTEGEALYRDDHPSFMFRLWTFSETFPQLLNYSPYWNGGVADFVGVSSGANGFGALTWPLWLLTEPQNVYTYAVCLVFILLVPLLAAWGLRALGAGKIACYVAGILALGVSQQYFLWLLNFGTIGALLATSFLIPMSACLMRVVWYRRLHWRLGVALVVSLVFLCMWPPCALMAAPLLISLAITPRWTKAKFVFLACCGGALLVFQAYPLWLVMTEGESLMTFVLEAPTEHVLPAATEAVGVEDGPSRLSQGWADLWDHLRQAHPIILFLGLGGVGFLPWRSARRWYLPAILGLCVLAGWGNLYFPNLQLDRMAIPLLIVALVPASLMAGRVLQDGRSHTAVIRGALIALLILGAWNVGRIYQNRGLARYVVADDALLDLVDYIKTDAPSEGRILFAGRTVHTIGGGHVALLPLITGREMVACDYYHFSPKRVEYQMPPNAWKDTPERTARYLELMDVTTVITRHPDWIAYFSDQKDRYAFVKTIGDKSIFTVKRESSRFELGKGTVQAHFNELRVKLLEPAEEVVLRYQWVDGFTADGGVTLSPEKIGPGVTLIRVATHGQQEFVIRF